ncbi:MAG: hypothetical protein DME18_12785 [Verrucomicrobia bacterium]|nr:MAG: hypothetical protein DME18_12785 [Verrucomicrobiota bacterium]
MKTIRVVSLVCLLALVAFHPMGAAERKKSKSDDKLSENSRAPGIKAEFGITTSERKVIQEYCVSVETRGKKGRKAKSLPPGLAKKAARGGKLPPGWEKKVVKTQIMPPEVFKECHPLPKEVVVRLPAPPVGTVLVAVEGKVVRLLEATREILDVFDVLPRPPAPGP